MTILPDPVLQHRLEAWRDERETNRYHMAHLADRAIALLEEEIRRAAKGEPDEL